MRGSIEAELARFAFAQPLEEMAAAERDVAVVAADLGLRAGGDGMAVGVDAQVHRRLAAAFAHRLQFDQRVGEREQRRRAGEQLGLEVGAKAVAEHRECSSSSATSHSCSTWRWVRNCASSTRMQSSLRFFSSSVIASNRSTLSSKAVRRRRQSDARADRAGARAVVEPRGPQHRLHAALAIIDNRPAAAWSISPRSSPHNRNRAWPLAPCLAGRVGERKAIADVG